MKFILPGIPIAKARHRTNRGRAYDPQQKEKEVVKWQLQVEITKAIHNEDIGIVKMASCLALAESFKVDLTFHMPAPKTDPWGLNSCVCKKDIDNISKFYLDCANGILFSDDHKIVELHAKKIYSPFPKTIIEIEPMEVTTRISSQAEKVLKILPPNEMCELLDDFWGVIGRFHSGDLEIIADAEKAQWFEDVSTILIHFADKHANKLKKIQSKAEKIA